MYTIIARECSRYEYSILEFIFGSSAAMAVVRVYVMAKARVYVMAVVRVYVMAVVRVYVMVMGRV